MLEPNKIEIKSVGNPTKPVEIHSPDSTDSSKSQELSVPSSNNVNETSSYSAYASAESSPSQNSLLVNSEPQLRTKPHKTDSNSATSSTSSLNSYLTIENSKLIDDLSSAITGRETPVNRFETAVNNSTTPTESFYEVTAEQVNKNYLEDEFREEFQSLPCHFPEEVLRQNKTASLVETDLVHVSSKDTVSSIINKEIESQLIDELDNSQNEKTAVPTPTLSPSQSKTSIKTAMASFFEKVLFGSNDKTVQVPLTPIVNQVKPTETNKSTFSNSLTASNDNHLAAKLATTTNGIASASSPNPDCSPYKLLLNELPSSKNIVVNDFNSRTKVFGPHNDTCTETRPTENHKPNQNTNNNLIESLASLNHKESDKIDPILSSATKSKSSTTGSSASVSTNNTNTHLIDDKSNTDNLVSSLTNSSGKKTSKETSQVDHVPASSREFCMDLNFNLAAQAAATAAGPVVVVDHLKSAPVPTPTPAATTNNLDHNRFTSNASTSSIHNDLKMILEESKEQNHRGILDSPPQSSHKKTNKSQQPTQASKPHRVPNSRTKSTSDKKSTESPASDADNLNLIKMMMLMVENNKNNISNNKLNQEKPVISWPKKENGRYRYSKEFLNQINEQRSEFIDQIYPDIFKAYCYCMNGKYWDPEKYFDISEFDKIPNRSMNNSRNYNNSSYNNNNQKQQNYQNRKRNTSTSNSKYDYQKNKNQNDFLTPSTSVLSSNNIESPQPLQVPKNSPKMSQQEHSQHLKNSLNLSTNSQKNNKENKKKLTNLLSTLGIEQSVKTNEADKILLNLIKNKEQPSKSTTKGNNLLDILNSKKEQFDNRQPSNILENLFQGKTSPQVVPQITVQPPKYFPLVLTAQELEMSQLLTQQRQTKHKLPINQNEISRFDDLANNTSDAYKQLVKNLSNHPLNSSSNAPSVNHLPQKVNKQQTQQPNWPVSNDGTNVLRQLLNLNTEKVIEVNKEKKGKKNRHHHHSKTKSPSTSMLTTSQNEPKFPAVNPHEKPFENYYNEENKDNKHVETVVASTLNHVLNKSPNTNSKNTIEDLFEKMNQEQINSKKKNIKSDNDHFNSLLNKMIPIVDNNKQKPKQMNEPSSSDILKWFTGSNTSNNSAASNFSPQILSEIEFMEMQRPKVLNKLY